MKMRSKMQNEKGFTLVELMVVVVILGILVAIAVPVYKSVTEKAERNSVMANLRTIDGAIATYYATDPDATELEDEEQGIEDLVNADLLSDVPEGPKTATYALEGTAPNQKANVSSTSEVGGKVLSAATLADLKKDGGWETTETPETP